MEIVGSAITLLIYAERFKCLSTCCTFLSVDKILVSMFLSTILSSSPAFFFERNDEDS